MDMTGERRIAAPRASVWAALNDPEVLRVSIPGCETLEKTSETDLKATAAISIGPIRARFSGKVQLTDLDPPNGYRIDGEGQGGVAGFAKGGATVHLAEDGAHATLLTYAVQAQVGGKIAQLGARLIDATAKQMADQFFDRFSARVAEAEPAMLMTEGAPRPAVAADPRGVSWPGTATAPAATSHPAAAPPPAISILSLIPAEPFGFPRVAFIAGAAYIAVLLLLFGGSLL